MTEDRRGPQEPSSRRWSMVARLPNVQEAELLAGLLRSREVECQLESRFFTQEPVALGTLGDIKLWVPHDQLESAREILTEVGWSAEADDPEDEPEPGGERAGRR